MRTKKDIKKYMARDFYIFKTENGPKSIETEISYVHRSYLLQKYVTLKGVYLRRSLLSKR